MNNTYVIIVTVLVFCALLLVKYTIPSPQNNINAWEQPIKGNSLPDEPLVKSVRIAINPTIELDFKSKAEIYEIRKKYVNQYRELAPKSYKPSETVFGEIVGGKAWWGEIGMSNYGAGNKIIEGMSEEARFLINPYLLVGLDSALYRPCRRYFLSKPIDPYPLEIMWESRNIAHAYYDVTSYWQTVKRCSGSSIWTRELFPIAYNAKDFGYNYMGADLTKSENIGFFGAAKSPILIKHFVHLATNCGYSGGCNNMSPSQSEMYMPIKKLPAKVHFKLWKKKPNSITAPADFTFIIYMI